MINKKCIAYILILCGTTMFLELNAAFWGESQRKGRAASSMQVGTSQWLNQSESEWQKYIEEHQGESQLQRELEKRAGQKGKNQAKYQEQLQFLQGLLSSTGSEEESSYGRGQRLESQDEIRSEASRLLKELGQTYKGSWEEFSSEYKSSLDELKRVTGVGSIENEQQLQYLENSWMSKMTMQDLDYYKKLGTQKGRPRPPMKPRKIEEQQLSSGDEEEWEEGHVYEGAKPTPPSRSKKPLSRRPSTPTQPKRGSYSSEESAQILAACDALNQLAAVITFVNGAKIDSQEKWNAFLEGFASELASGWDMKTGSATYGQGGLIITR